MNLCWGVGLCCELGLWGEQVNEVIGNYPPEVHKSKATAVRLIKSVYIVTKHRKETENCPLLSFCISLSSFC